MNIFILLFSAFLFGIFSKAADLFDEHGAKEPFFGAAITCGILWGFFGSCMVILNHNVGIFYVALLLYWILRVKVDYRNHGIGAVMILITALYFIPNQLHVSILEIIGIITLYEFTKILETWGQKKSERKIIHIILKCRLCLVPCLYSIYLHDMIILYTAYLALLGVIVTNLVYNRVAFSKKIRN